MSIQQLTRAFKWANRVKSQKEFAFTAPFHYITVDGVSFHLYPCSSCGRPIVWISDDPPTSCSVDLERDCGPDGCVGRSLLLSPPGSAIPNMRPAYSHSNPELHQTTPGSESVSKPVLDRALAARSIRNAPHSDKYM